jgi:hypothetical protein
MLEVEKLKNDNLKEGEREREQIKTYDVMLKVENRRLGVIKFV